MAPLLYQLFRRELQFFHLCNGGVWTPVDGMVSQKVLLLAQKHSQVVCWDWLTWFNTTLYNSNLWQQAWQLYFTNWFIQMWSWLWTMWLSSFPCHEGKGESNNKHHCGTLNPMMGQNVAKGDVQVKKWYHHNVLLFHGGYHHHYDIDWDSELTCHCDVHGPQPPLGHAAMLVWCVFLC